MGGAATKKSRPGSGLTIRHGLADKSVCARVGPLGYDLEGRVAELVDGEAHAIARRRELGGDAAPRHHDHVSTEHAAAPVEEVGQPRHRLEGMAEGVARLALAGGLVVEPRTRHCALEVKPATR